MLLVTSVVSAFGAAHVSESPGPVGPFADPPLVDVPLAAPPPAVTGTDPPIGDSCRGSVIELDANRAWTIRLTTAVASPDAGALTDAPSVGRPAVRLAGLDSCRVAASVG